MNYTIKVERQITEEQMSDIMCAAFEGGINYWVEGMIRVPDFHGLDYASEVVGHGYPAFIKPDDEDEEVEINRQKLEKALEILAKDYPAIAHRLASEEYDAGDADVLVQLACFGTVVYG